MSTMTSTGEFVKMQNVPSAATGTNAAPATVSPGCQLTFDTAGTVPAHGYAARNPGVVPPVTVMVAATAWAPAGAWMPIVDARPVRRVSSVRSGVVGANRRPPVATNTPCRSTTTSVAVLLKTHSERSGWCSNVVACAPRAWPARKLTLDASGRSAPHGHTVRNPADAGSAAVTLTATAVASGPTASGASTERSTVSVPPAA